MQKHFGGGEASPRGRRYLRAGCVAVALALSPVSVLATAAGAAGYSVEGGPLFEALQNLAAQADFRLYANPDSLKGFTAQPITDERNVQLAVEHLLRGTGIDFKVNLYTREIMIGKTRTEVVKPRVRRSTSPPVSLVSDRQQDDGASNVGFEVLVTGTQISGGAPIAGDVITLNLDQFPVTTAGTMADLVNTLPQLFGGGPSQILNMPGPEAQTNSGLGASLNLRGLGSEATLVMIDGRRLAPGGSAGEFFDVSLIPFLAINHIDILPTGTSAVYGTDAIAGVVNFVARTPAEPSQTRIEEDMVTQGSLKQFRLSQGVGKTWDSGGLRVTVELQKETPLQAQDRSFENSDLAGSGGPNLDPNTTNPGNIQVGNVTWAIPRGTTGPLSVTQLQPGTENRQNLYLGANILPEQTLASLFLKGTQQINDTWSLDLECLVSGRHTTENAGGEGATLVVPNTNPFYFNPTGGTPPVTVDYNLGPDLGPQLTRASVLVSEAAIDLQDDISDTAKLTFSIDEASDEEHQSDFGEFNPVALADWLASSDPLRAFDPFQAGSSTNPLTLVAIEAHPSYEGRSQISGLAVKFEGKQLKLPGGTVQEAVGMEFRDQTLETDWAQSAGDTAPTTNRYSRWLTAAFADIDVPIFGPGQQYIAMNAMDVSFAGRIERNSDFGRTLAPLSQLEWSPIQRAHLKASWGLSYRAPTLADLDESANTTVITQLADPTAHGQLNNFLVAGGNNAALSEERGLTKTLGAGFGIPFDEDTTLAWEMTYFNIQYTGRITSLPYSPDVLADPAYASVIIRNPSPSFRDHLCTTGQFFGSVTDCENTDIAGIVDLRLHNTADLYTDGIDLHGLFSSKRPWGQVAWELYGTYIMHYAERQAPGLPAESLLDTLGNPIDWRLLNTLRWTHQALEAAVTVHFQNHSWNTLTTPTTRIGSWTTLDLQLTYRVPAESNSVFRNFAFRLGVENVSDRNPPRVYNLTTEAGWDSNNALPYGRLVGLNISRNF